MDKNKILLSCPRRIKDGNLTYLKNLYESLLLNDLFEVFLLVHEDNRSEFGTEERNIFSCKSKNPIGELFYLKKCEFLIKPDLIHFTNTMFPLFYSTKSKVVCTSHDLNFLTISQGWVKNLYKRAIYKKSFNKSNKIICVSDYTRDVYRKFCNYSNDGVFCTIHEACNGNILPTPDKKNHIIAFGHRKHKNAEASLYIFKYLLKKDDSYKLTILGCGAYVDFLKELTAKLNLSQYVDFPGFVTDDELIELFSKSKFLIFLSLYEGFGLPILEAMSMNCVVITHKQCSLFEVGGDAAIYINNSNFGYKKAAITINEIGKSEQIYKNLILLNKSNLKRFSWRKTADKTTSLYCKVLDEF